MKKVTQLTLATAIAAASAISAPAMADISTNIGAGSDYVWRGVSQTGNGAAVSGGIDFESDSGFYTGTWISNTASGSSETDIYAGFNFDLGSDMSLTLGGIGYLYPTSETNANFGEVHADFAVAGFSAGVAVTVISEIEDDAYTEGDVFYYVGYGADLGGDWSLGGTYGFYDFDADSDENEISYGYIQLDLGKSVGEFGDLTFSVSIADEESGTDQPLTFVSWSKGF